MERHAYRGPPAATIASMNLPTVTSAATTPSFLAPSLSWTSSIATMSGDARWSTMPAASLSNLLCGSVGSRFSTLYVATASSSFFCLRVTSGSVRPALTVPSWRAATVYVPAYWL